MCNSASCGLIDFEAVLLSTCLWCIYLVLFPVYQYKMSFVYCIFFFINCLLLRQLPLASFWFYLPGMSFSILVSYSSGNVCFFISNFKFFTFLETGILLNCYHSSLFFNLLYFFFLFCFPLNSSTCLLLVLKLLHSVFLLMVKWHNLILKFIHFCWFFKFTNVCVVYTVL